MVRDWIAKAQEQGWRVAGVSGASLTLACAQHGCASRLTLPLDNLGDTPAPCGLDHKQGFGAPAFANYEGLVDELRRKRVQIGLDQLDLCAAMGVAEGYINKLESFQKTASPAMLALWAQSLGLVLTVKPAPLPPATIRAIEQRRSRPYQPNSARFKHGR